MFPLPRIIATLFLLLLVFMCGFAAHADEYDQKASVGPVRLSYIEGEVSFWRQGAPDWVGAQLNTPLAAGDELYVGRDGDLELQMGSRAFVRADDDTQLSLVNQTPGFIQFKVISGRVSFDLRVIPTGYSVEVDTPNAVFTIDHPGYYRVDVEKDVYFITRLGGQAMMVPAGGQAMSVHPSEEIVVQGDALAQAKTYVAPEIDQWDRWNYDRTDGMIDTISERYLPYGVAGASDLDHYGNWRVVPEYGPIWVPDAIPSGWVPYSTGRWSWDPYYQWTWIDDAPWGWTPFHYGRWVYLGGYWAWAPGPVTRHPVYAPALVGFFNVGPNMADSISNPGVGWVALGWGEPVTPWWGRPGFVGRPWWGGWRGPRVVNNVVVKESTIINVTNITYSNIRVNNSIVATTHEHFGKGRVHDAFVRVTRPRELEHVHGALRVKPGPTSLVGGAPVGIRPPEGILPRSVVGSRPPREPRLPWQAKTSKPETKTAPVQRYVPIPKHPSNGLPRPEFGNQTGEERSRPPSPPRFEERRRVGDPTVRGGMVRERTVTDQKASREFSNTAPVASPQHVVPEVTLPRAVHERERLKPEPRKIEAAPDVPRAVATETLQHERAELPGKPANRVYHNKDKEDERQRSRQKHE